MPNDQADAREEGVDCHLRSVEFDGYSPAEAFGKATAWLARRDGAVGVLDIGWHRVPDDEPFNLVIYYYPE